LAQQEEWWPGLSLAISSSNQQYIIHTLTMSEFEHMALSVDSLTTGLSHFPWMNTRWKMRVSLLN